MSLSRLQELIIRFLQFLVLILQAFNLASCGLDHNFLKHSLISQYVWNLYINKKYCSLQLSTSFHSCTTCLNYVVVHIMLGKILYKLRVTLKFILSFVDWNMHVDGSIFLLNVNFACFQRSLITNLSVFVSGKFAQSGVFLR